MSKKLAIAMFGQKRLSREGGVEIVVRELCTRMVQNGCDVTCYNRAGHHVSGAEYDDAGKTEYEGIRQKSVPTIERRGFAAVSSSFFAALYSAFGKYDVVHIHAEGPAFFAWLPKIFGKRVVVTVHGIDWQREKWQSGLGSKFIHQGEKNAAKYADEVIVLSKGVQDYFKETYGRETHFMYAKGMTTRQISETIEDIYGFETSEGFISDVTDKIMPQIEDWQNRPLDEVYPILYIDAIHYSVRDNGVIRKLAAYVILGINMEGKKEVLTISVGDNESAKYWLSVMNELKNRGVKDVLIICADGLTGIKEAIGAAFPKTEYQRCIVHQVRNTLKYVPDKDRIAFATDLKTIYQAVDEKRPWLRWTE